MAEKNTRHLIDWKYWKEEDIRDLLDLAVKVKHNRWAYQGRLMGRSIALIFQKTSTRTRISFESGINELGGHPIFMDWNTSNFMISDIGYEAKYLSRNTSAIMARLKSNKDLLKIAENAEVPVINGCCDLYHPCQALADCMTIFQYAGKTEGIRLTMIWRQADEVSRKSAKEKGFLRETDDIRSAVNDADFVYTDTWVNMEFFNDSAYSEQKAKIIQKMMPYQINADLMKASKAYIMHDMPIHPGYEITDEMSAVYAYYPRDRKEFLHIENLVRIILYAKAAGFTDEQLNDLTLRDGYSTTNVRAIIDMINFIRQEYGFRENEIITQIIENEKPVPGAGKTAVILQYTRYLRRRYSRRTIGFIPFETRIGKKNISDIPYDSELFFAEADNALHASHCGLYSLYQDFPLQFCAKAEGFTIKKQALTDRLAFLHSHYDDVWIEYGAELRVPLFEDDSTFTEHMNHISRYFIYIVSPETKTFDAAIADLCLLQNQKQAGAVLLNNPHNSSDVKWLEYMWHTLNAYSGYGVIGLMPYIASAMNPDDTKLTGVLKRLTLSSPAI
ncbi:hypothetical protein CHS0354_001968 [Potamilus streckersoni]|uniref:ornithine carbamoyltransferase n=1 Tax=Potamilus streckersoni TaxID=2493646 RepID=A0AAE0T5K0_9BIVA|nr:hypothetical protein CHS0354_001968 [Potamilus streckersoni]